jgi:hypothetical protein
MERVELEAYRRSATSLKLCITAFDVEWATQNGVGLSRLLREGEWEERDDGVPCLEGVVDEVQVRLRWDGDEFGLEVCA